MQPTDRSTAKPEERGTEAPAAGDISDRVSEMPIKEPELIETELGPLPADLWELIGESPQPTPSRTRQTTASATLEEKIPEERRSPGSQEGDRVVPLGLVQRQPAEPPAAEQETATSTSAGAPAMEGTAKPPAEIDMDELAMRVYGEVKKRLALEWERLRRRF
jgi:hypothetical protein